jgi:cation:H+ antiporter
VNILTFLYITTGIVLVWFSAQKLEKYSVSTAVRYGMSPFLIGSTVIAFGTSAPEILTSLFAAFENKSVMVVGNVIGSNVANIALVFGLTLGVLFFKKEDFSSKSEITKNLLILIFSTLLVWVVIAINPFHIYSSIVLLIALLLVIVTWYKTNAGNETQFEESDEKYLFLKLFASLASLVIAAWLITKGAFNILETIGIGELFIGFTVLAIGTSLPEIAAALALAAKGRNEAVAGTLIGSNIFNGLLVLSIPGIVGSSVLFNYHQWVPLLAVLLIVTVIFCLYLFLRIKKPKRASLGICILLFISYFLSLSLAYS